MDETQRSHKRPPPDGHGSFSARRPSLWQKEAESLIQQRTERNGRIWTRLSAGYPALPGWRPALRPGKCGSRGWGRRSLTLCTWCAIVYRLSSADISPAAICWGLLMIATAALTRQLNVAANRRAVENAHNFSYCRWPGQNGVFRNRSWPKSPPGTSSSASSTSTLPMDTRPMGRRTRTAWGENPA